MISQGHPYLKLCASTDVPGCPGCAVGRGGEVGSDSSRSPAECCVTLLMFTGLSHSWCIHSIILFAQKREIYHMQWKGNNKNSFIEHLICTRHLIHSLPYLSAQRQAVHQAKDILLENDNTVTQIQGGLFLFCFLFQDWCFQLYSAMT